MTQEIFPGINEKLVCSPRINKVLSLYYVVCVYEIKANHIPMRP